MPLRSRVVGAGKGSEKPADRTLKVAPYGYCLIEGKLVVDPKEHAIVQMIERSWHKGMSHRAIAKQLNGLKLKPRRASSWSQTLVSSIIKRLSNQEKLP